MVVFEEAEQVLLDVDLLDLSIDCLELAVDLGLFHFAKASNLASHSNDVMLFLNKLIRPALFLDFIDDLLANKVEFNVDFYQVAILPHQ